jgi:hypothetical protein
MGVLAVTVGSIFGLRAISGNSDSNANGRCDASGCDASGKQLRNDALRDATVSTVLFGAGVAAIGGSVVLFITARTAAATAARIELAPLVGRSAGGLGLRGKW